MTNLKIRVNSADESKEAQELFFKLGFQWRGLKSPFDLFYPTSMDNYYIVLTKGSKEMQIAGAFRNGLRAWKEITLPELRDMAVLNRNDVNDATHEDKDDPEFKYRLINSHWHVITEGNPVWRKDSIDLNEAPLFIKPIEKTMKEYLMPSRNYEYILTDAREALEPHAEDWIEIPEGAIRARFYQYDPDALEFENSACQWWGDETKKWIDHMDYSKSLRDSRVVWQREQDEPFLTPECTLNEQYAEIEEVRQHKHYFKDVSGLNEIDVYMVLKLFNVTDPCLQHIAKKALCAGQRGHKDFKKDLQDILDTAKRAVEINNG